MRDKAAIGFALDQGAKTERSISMVSVFATKG
jgi:hypothetical protein